MNCDLDCKDVVKVKMKVMISFPVEKCKKRILDFYSPVYKYEIYE